MTVIDVVGISVSGVKGRLSSGFPLFMVQLFDDRPQRNQGFLVLLWSHMP